MHEASGTGQSSDASLDSFDDERIATSYRHQVIKILSNGDPFAPGQRHAVQPAGKASAEPLVSVSIQAGFAETLMSEAGSLDLRNDRIHPC